MGEPLDLVFTAQNYHDVVCYLSADDAVAMNKAIFAALKPGGRFVVIDHAAPGMTDPAVIKKIHRIDEDYVKKQVLAAGFVLEGESKVLRNPADGHDKGVFDPSIRGHTDQFVLSFKKPG
ncbi:MAG: class I SAM-dependent methyltransferase [Proteobacteria bacterium]|nr:class I SAM-dependent methyltransferase [Pseudomonadota bacterium]